jgi:hypothetical protein
MVGTELYERGILNPKGGQHWDPTTISYMLNNRKYVGDACWNVGHDGKYSEVANGEIQTSDTRITPRTRNACADWIVVPNVHEPLIEREQFERAQLKLLDNRQRTSPATKDHAFLLSGMLVCARCGWRMIGQTDKGQHYYVCGFYHHVGNHGCSRNAVKESKLVRCIIDKLQATILNPKNLAKLRKEVQKQAQAFERDRPGQEAALQKQLDGLERKIDAAVERMPLIEPDILPEYGAMVRRLKEDRERVRGELARLQASRPETAVDLDPTIKAVEKNLNRLRESVLESDPVLAREFLRQMVSKVELHFDAIPNGKHRKSTFRRGVIYVDPQGADGLSPATSNLWNATSRAQAEEGVSAGRWPT